MEMFDYIKTLFDKEAYREVTDSDKKKHSFMMLRYVSIKYPLEANSFNLNGVDQLSMSDYWHWFFSNNYKSAPNWLYTKTKKNEEKIKALDKALLKRYCREFKLETREVEALEMLFAEEFAEVLKKFKAVIEEDK